MARLTRLMTLSLLVLLLASVSLPERPDQLSANNYLNDYAGVIDAASANRINALITELDRKTQAQVAVVTIKTLDGMEVSDFANRLFERWGVGDKRDRGVLVLLAVQDRKYWVEVGYGLEPILPDGKVGGFGRAVVPLLKEARYGDALYRLTTDIARTIAAEAGVQLTGIPARPQEPVSLEFPDWARFLPLILFALLFLLPMLMRRGGRGRYGRRASGCNACLFPLFFGGLDGGRGWGRGGGWSGGNWGGGFGGGGFGGGGFGGFGGGSSGGGGAGGSW